MSKYDALWQYIGKQGQDSLLLTFTQIEKAGGMAIDHSFLQYKKELAQYGYRVGKISLKQQTVEFIKAPEEGAEP